MHENSISVICGVLGGFISYAFGVNQDLEFLLWAITLDIIIGVLASFVNENLTFNSRKMYKGIVKKIVMLTLVMFSHQLDVMMKTDGIIAKTVTWYFIANEGLSCLENAGKCGLTLPKILANSLEQLKGLTNDNKKP